MVEFSDSNRSLRFRTDFFWIDSSVCFAIFFFAILFCPWVAIGVSQDHPSISFSNDVVPVLTKAGCNAGSCHAKAGGGQKGFQLSLLGFEPKEDYESLTRESRGRRVFLPAPGKSLVLQKATGTVPHGGGARFSVESTDYQTIFRWIEQGARFDGPEQKSIVSLQVNPSTGVVPMHGTQQLQAIARYSDGSTRDVTRLALFESNTRSMASVSESGLVKTTDIPGRVAIMVRYQGNVSVFTAAIPLGVPVEQMPKARNFVDTHVFNNLKQIGIPPSDICDDSTFIRRASLDIIGRLPTVEESRDFLADSASDKRDRLIERLLKNPGYADYFASKWTPLLKNRRDEASDITANFAFHAWIRDSLLANVGYDQLVRELLAATGTVVANPPVAWYKRVKDSKEQLEDVAQLFLGVRMQCAQCHHHPFEKWSQDDYYRFAAFFSRIGRKPTGVRGEDLIFHQRGNAVAKNPKSGIDQRPEALGESVGAITPDQDPRLYLANWMSRPDNPYFAKAVVNRYWKHFFKRALIEPEDDIRDTNPPTNPELLKALEKHFIESGFDLKELVRVITRSTTYQLSSRPNQHNLRDLQNYSRFYPRRLQAEVLLDSIDDMSGSRTTFANLPKGTRAIALPDNSYNKASAFLRIYGRPESQSVCECERVRSSSLAQILHMLNSSEIKSKLAYGQGRAATYAKSKLSINEKIEEVYLQAFSRKPNARELEFVEKYLYGAEFEKVKSRKPTDPIPVVAKANYEDLIWAIINTKEFLFNH